MTGVISPGHKPLVPRSRALFLAVWAMCLLITSPAGVADECEYWSLESDVEPPICENWNLTAVRTKMNGAAFFSRAGLTDVRHMSVSSGESSEAMARGVQPCPQMRDWDRGQQAYWAACRFQGLDRVTARLFEHDGRVAAAVVI